MKIKPKNWEKFQHYKDRCPPWIKLHRDLLNNRDFMCLPFASKSLAPLLWLLASEQADGIFDATIEEVVFRLRITPKEAKDGLKPLIQNGFFEVIESDASMMLASCYQVAIPETEAETETEQRKTSSSPSANDAGFEEFWKAYPRKVGKGAALASWRKAKPPINAVLSAIQKARQSPDWLKDRGAFIPHPSTWLNQSRWEDEGMDYAALAGKRDSEAPRRQEIDESDALRWLLENYDNADPSMRFAEWPPFAQSEYLKQIASKPQNLQAA
jgi:hypothetical protein